MSKKGGAIKKDIGKALNPVKAIRDNKKKGMSFGDTLKESWRETSDPLDIQGRQKKIDGNNAAKKESAADQQELAEIQARMMPNSPLNSFRPFVDTRNQPPDMSGRLPPMAAGQQYDPAMLRGMMQMPQYGQQADQQWQNMKQSTMQPPVAPQMSQPGNLPPTIGVSGPPQMNMPTEQQMAMIAMQNRMRTIR